MRVKSIRVAMLSGMVAMLLGRASFAQDRKNSLDAQRFTPAVTHDGWVMAEGSGVREPEDRWELGLLLNYAYRPLIVADANGGFARSLIGGRLGFDAMASVTVAGPFAIGLDVPFFIAQSGAINPSFAGLGDLRIVPKIRLLDDRDKVGLALVAELRAPTHVGDFAGGARMLTFWPKIVFDHRFRKGVRIGANLGAAIRERSDFLNVVSGTEFTYAGGLGYRFGGTSGKIELGAELDGAVSVLAPKKETIPLEAFAYLKANPTEEWEILAGPGFGLVPGFGVPVVRAFAGIRWTPTSHDRDHDGVSDARDLCPDVAEDRDGDHDSDGCPEDDPDDDHDGIPNDKDECPRVKETINGFQDDDGCPDTGDPRVIYVDGKVKTLDTVKFRSGSAEIEPESHSLLNQVALTIKANPEIKRVRVEGHTDETGARERNIELSKARANAVREYLIARGIKPNTIVAEGYGSDRPIASGDDPKSLAKNRRVEFIVEQ